MNENDDLMDDFASYMEARSRKKREEVVAAKVTLTEEQNMFNATVGLRIKCGVCGSTHKSSRIDVLPSLKVCVNKLVEKFQQEQRRNYSPDKVFPEWTDENAALMLRLKIVNVIDEAIPNNAVWRATHTKFIKKVRVISERVDETCVREVNADVPMQDILGAADSVEYVHVKLREFHARMVEEQKQSAAKQFEMAGRVGEDLLKWRTIPVEKWKVTNAQGLMYYENAESLPEPRETITVNEEQISDAALFNCFTTISTDRILWQTKDKRVERYIIDVDLWKDGMPALLWNARAQQGYKDYSRRIRRIRHGKPIYGLSFLSTWSGKVYLIHAKPKTVKQLTECEFQMNEIVPRKADKDI